MTLDDVMERLSQFYPNELTEEEREEFCAWWENVSDELQAKARVAEPSDAMVADIETYGRRNAYMFLYQKHDGFLHYMRLYSEEKARCAGLENVNKFLSSELDRCLTGGAQR